MKYKLMALDLDDSLLNDQLQISEKNRKAIQAAEAMGIHVVFCSGRAMESMMTYVNDIGVHEKEDYIISYNGAAIDRLDGVRVFFKPIEGDALIDLIKLGREYDIDVQLYTDKFLIEKYTERSKRYEELTNTPVEVIEDLTTIPSSIKVLYNYIANEKLEKLRLEIIEKHGDKFNVFYSKPHYIEVLNKEANKGLAVQELARMLNIKREEVIAVGDGFNDVSMLDYAGLGVAVQNAPEGVKMVADYITKGTNNEDAIWEVYEKFINI